MKSIFIILTFATVSFVSFGQISPYVEFTEQNQTITGAIKHVDADSSVWHIVDNNDSLDIRTYIFYQRPEGVPNIPNVPSGWSSYKVVYDQKNEIPFDFTGPVTYIITEDQAVYVKIN